jgi:hypothetical protein
MDSILSWGSLSARPSTDIPFARPLPRAEALFGPTAPPVSAHVPPAWFRTTSTAFSARQLQVCCTLLPVLGFATFPDALFRTSRGRPGEPTLFPATQARTLRRLPLVSSRTASPRLLVFTAAVALLPLPPDLHDDRGRRAAAAPPPKRGSTRDFTALLPKQAACVAHHRGGSRRGPYSASGRSSDPPRWTSTTSSTIPPPKRLESLSAQRLYRRTGRDGIAREARARVLHLP